MKFAPPRSDRLRGGPSIADTVLATGAAPRSPARLLILALVLATATHVGAWYVASKLDRSRADKPAKRPDIEVALEPPPPPPPALEPPEPPPPTAATPPTAAATPKQRAVRAASAPAQAGAIVAREPDPNAPVDLSGDAFVTGTASAYAGGVTASSGTGTHAVSEVVRPSAPPPSAATLAPRLSRPVELAEDEWQCPWPEEAELAEIDEQTVTLRVRVDAEGRARRVTLIDDPGSGFGAAARVCALQTRFTPALDALGNATVAESPPIRVRFTR